MAKILFIVNDHPNEAFAISVAREAAKWLRKAGHNMIWEMTDPNDTVLGKVLKNPNMKVTGKTFLEAQHQSYERMGKLILKHKPKITYNFHTSPHDDPLWTDPRKTPADFDITHSKSHGKTWMFVEIKAHYKKLPERHLSKGIIAIAAHSPYYGSAHYLREGTSQQLTRKMGLAPEILGRMIAERIENHLRNPKVLQHHERGTFPRVFQKIKQRKIRRRTQRA
jgi:hypothetical protein